VGWSPAKPSRLRCRPCWFRLGTDRLLDALYLRSPHRTDQSAAL
jgi:hypothetical protein